MTCIYRKRAAGLYHATTSWIADESCVDLRCAVRRYCVLVSLIHNIEIIFNTVVYMLYDGRLFDYNHYEQLVEAANVNLR